MDKPAIKKFAVWARNKLIADTKYRAGLVGVTETAVAEPLPQSNETVQFFDVGLPQPYRIEGDAVTQRQRFVAELNKETAKQGSYTAAYQTVVDKVAYTWFNRLIAVRYMEVNDLLPSRTRVLSSADGRAEPQIVTSPFDAVLDYTPAEQQQIVNLKNDNKLDEVFRLLFLKQCAALGDCLPRLFEQVDDYMPLLLALSFTDKDGVVCHLVNDIPESDWQDAVQIVGWLYQYYNTEPKEQVFANLKKNIKISAENIPAATQLFTPDWIVRYMVENSLGRLWSEGHPDCGLKENWKYYLEEAQQEPEVQAKLAEIRKEYAALNPEDIKLIDPCMGSGHILVYAFDVLMQIYESAGYSQCDAAKSILENNIYGLDIDDRAYQLAYFAVMMKARQYNRRILNGENTCHVYAIQESNSINRAHLKYFGAGMDDIEKNAAKMQLEGLLDTLTDAKEYGSILNVESYNWDLLRRFVAAEDTDGQIGMDSVGVEDTAEQLNRLIDIGETASRKYDIVVTNPPYRAVADCTERLNSFVKANYPDSKNDLSTIFMEKTLSMSKPHGFMAMINIPVWMSKSSFEQLRYKLLALHTFVAVAHCGRGIFGSDFGTVAFVVQNSHIKMYKALFRQLFDELGAVDSVEQKEKWFLEGKGVFYAYPDKFLKIASYPIAYWVSDRLLTILNECKPLTEFAAPRKGLTTGDNDTFARLWFEIALAKFGINGNNHAKWYPMTKGGDFRRWYGNNSYVVNWENDGEALKNFKDDNGKLRSVIRNSQYYFQDCISWNDTTATGKIAFRYQTKEFIPNASGPCVYANKNLWYLFGLLNSKVSQVLLEILAPNMKFEVGQMGLVPIIMENRPEVEELSHNTVRIAKSDWDSFETSWNFKKHPLLRNVSTISEAFNQWNTECDDRFNQLKANEEELNRIFIDIYGLQDELTPEVEDKDVTVRRADLTREIKSLLSYAVGCMFGRYSLDVDGLAYAGGKWDDSKYTTFIPDADNVLPITDEEYFTDDIVGRFVEFVKVVYGTDTLEDNLAFIAKALGTKGTSPRAVIRNYFLNGFYADHVKIYQKRPIYWLYDSGKQNGFKALIYMHRYNADTSGLVRADYLYKMEQVYESEIARMDDAIAHGASREVAQATKRKEKLVKQLKECKDYDDRLGHIALARIPIDLDDGVKVNYDKVQTGADGKKQAILAKI